ncbi:MAG: PIN domain-containing protein [Halobacteria archaeon]|nr:PIN domain-containing protein [Halobacteria archaeon]
MESIVVDSYAWVEYSEGSKEGENAKKYIDEGDYNLYTPSIVVGELSDRATREGMRTDWEEKLLPFIRRQSVVVSVDGAIAERAGRVKWEMREESPQAGLADAIVLSVAREYDAKVLTGDPNFLVDTLSDEVIDVTS